MSDSHSLLSGSADKTVKVWDARLGGKGGEKGGCVGTFGEGAEVWGVSWRPLEANQAEIGKRFVSAGDERAVRCVFHPLFPSPPHLLTGRDSFLPFFLVDGGEQQVPSNKMIFVTKTHQDH
jgi:WD40 repeat protein